MNRLYMPDHNHIFRKLSRMSSGDFPRLPGLKYDDIIRKNGPKSDRTNRFLKIDRDPRGSIGDINVFFVSRKIGFLDLQ